jgi:hypothetical protein
MQINIFLKFNPSQTECQSFIPSWKAHHAPIPSQMTERERKNHPGQSTYMQDTTFSIGVKCKLVLWDILFQMLYKFISFVPKIIC